MGHLKTAFLDGKAFIYYPQEHFSDKPISPEHKRANEVSGEEQKQSFWTIGFQSEYDGGCISILSWLTILNYL